MQRIFYAWALLLIIFAIGCGGNTVKVKGTIKMADGTPIETGTVIFRSGTEQFSADIQPGGTFSPGKYTDGDGITPGVYQIGIVGVRPKGENPSAAIPAVPVPQGASGGLIHPKYQDATQSGLTIDTSKTKTLDLVLDPP